MDFSNLIKLIKLDTAKYNHLISKIILLNADFTIYLKFNHLIKLI